MKTRERLRTAIFLLLALLLLLGAWAIFDRKTTCYYTEKIRGYYNEPAETIDVVGFGSSRMYCTLDPMVLHHETGLRSYVFATQQQPLKATWYYMLEALKRQKPRLMILETAMILRDDLTMGDEMLRDSLDPLPWSDNKRALIRQMVPLGRRASYYFNFLEYHNRWKELSEKDFDFSYLRRRDPFRGYMYLTPERGEEACQQNYDNVEAEPLPEENLELLRRMKALAEEHGAAFMLFATPFRDVTDELGMLKSLHLFCEEEGIPFLDLNVCYDELGLEKRDFLDTIHFNVRGSAKATRYLARYVEENFALSPQPDPLDAEIAENYAKYIAEPGY